LSTAGFLVGSTIFGLNLLITCAFFRMNYNDAFSAFRMNRYNNFLRLRIHGDSVDVFAIGLQDVPERSDWRRNPSAADGNPEEPVYIPSQPCSPISSRSSRFEVTERGGQTTCTLDGWPQESLRARPTVFGKHLVSKHSPKLFQKV
jgi:hypothetical protein